MRSILVSIGNILSFLYAKAFLIMVVRRNTKGTAKPKIFVVNHPNTLDPFYLLGILGEPVSILITEHVFHIPVIGALVKRAGHIPVTDDGSAAYRQAKKTLDAGKSILIFAEGEISYGTCMLRRFHTGAVRLTLETGAQIIPVGIHLDARKIWRRETVIRHQPLIVTWYRYGWYTVVFGAPVTIHGSNRNRLLVRKETILLRRHVMSCIREAQQVGVEDRRVHKRRVKTGFHTALRGIYRVACFIGVIALKLSDLGIRIGS